MIISLFNWLCQIQDQNSRSEIAWNTTLGLKCNVNQWKYIKKKKKVYIYCTMKWIPVYIKIRSVLWSFGRLGSAHQALLVPPPERLAVFIPLQLWVCSWSMHKTCQGDTHQPKATMHSTCASWLSKPAAIPRPLLLCLARERLFSYMLKMHVLSEYVQKDLIFFFFFF